MALKKVIRRVKRTRRTVPTGKNARYGRKKA